jgi:hypothetical protein
MSTSMPLRPRSDEHERTLDLAEHDYRTAEQEARAQAEALRRAVCQANAVVSELEDLLENLRAILEYPRAYGWPPVEREADEPASG